MKIKKTFGVFIVFSLLFLVPLMSAACPEVIEDCSQEQIKDLNYDQLEKLNDGQIESMLRKYPFSMEDNENVFQLVDDRAKEDVSILNDHDSIKESWFQKQGVEYSEVEVKDYKNGVVTVDGEKYRTLIPVKDPNLKKLNPILTEDGNLILGYESKFWPGTGVKPGDTIVREEGIKGQDPTFRFNSETKKYESVNYPGSYESMTAEEFEEYKKGKETENYGESAKSISVFGEVNVNKDGSVNVKGGAEKYGKDYREMDKNNKKGLTIKFEEDGVLIHKSHFAELDKLIEPGKTIRTDYNTLNGGVKILSGDKKLLLKGTAFGTNRFIGDEKIGEEVVAASVEQDTEYILGNSDPSRESYIKLSGDKLSVGMNEVGKNGERAPEILMRVTDPNLKRTIENKGDGKIYVLEKDGKSMKVYEKGKITSAGILNTGDSNFLASNGHEYKLGSDQSFIRCSEPCKEVGKAYQRLDGLVKETTERVVGDITKRARLTDSTIVTEAYTMKVGSKNLEVYRTYDVKTGKEEVFISDGSQVLYNEGAVPGGQNYKQMVLDEDGNLELARPRLSKELADVIDLEDTARGKTKIPDGAGTYTPKVNLKTRGQLFSPLKERNAGDILIKDPRIKGIGSEVYRLNPNTGRYDIVASSWPGSIGKRTMTPTEFSEYQKGKHVEVVPYKYDGFDDAKAGAKFKIVDSNGNNVGKIERGNLFREYDLLDPNNKKIGSYKSLKDAQNAFETKALHEWYSKPKLEDWAEGFADDIQRAGAKVNRQTLNQFKYEGTRNYLSGLTQAQGGQLLELQKKHGLRFKEGFSKSNDILVYDSRGNLISSRYLFFNKKWASQVISDINKHYNK